MAWILKDCDWHAVNQMFDDKNFPCDSIRIKYIYIQIGNTLESHLKKATIVPLTDETCILIY